ncbi:hypothetical protein UFOVP68_52 [uncultured Caudovirales phage]|uniref:Uncharacterized protein n=1 Tax=uncultured Caudovirales phage TaxID=2100421 RepID=A0A6J5L193_9CAUD|nr:hypothetical protein UFOVP68_52 [uncultured Caudovirales phage]
MTSNARIALSIQIAADLRAYAATKARNSSAYYSAIRNARVALFQAARLRLLRA